MKSSTLATVLEQVRTVLAQQVATVEAELSAVDQDWIDRAGQTVEWRYIPEWPFRVRVTYVAKDWATWNEQHPYIPHPRQSAGDGPHQAQSAKWEPSEELKADILDYTEGYNSSPALDNAVREGPQTAPEISRGLMVQEGDFNTIVNGMKEGESVQLPPTSWSSDPAVAAEFASKESPSTAGYDELTHSITFNLDAGAKGIDIAPYAMEDFAYQKEWLVAGNYTVKSVEVSGTSAVIGLGVK